MNTFSKWSFGLLLGLAFAVSGTDVRCAEATSTTASNASTSEVSEAEAREIVIIFLDEARNKKILPISPRMKKLPDKLKLKEMFTFVRDPNPDVRDSVLASALFIAKEGDSASVRSEAVEKLLRAAQAGLPVKLYRLKEVQPASFSAVSQRLIYQIFQRNKTHPTLVELIGLARVQAAKPELQQFAAALEVVVQQKEEQGQKKETQSESNIIEPDSQIYERSQLLQYWWALSCLGDDDAAEKLVNYRKSHLEHSAFSEIASTRHPIAIKALMKFVFSDVQMLLDEEYQWTVALSAAMALAEVVEGFPAPFFTDENGASIGSYDAYVEVARKWVREHGKSFKIKM